MALKEGGFLLLDILMALALMSICSLVLITTQAHLTNYRQRTCSYLHAVSLGRSYIEKIRTEGKIAQGRIVKGIFDITCQDISYKASSNLKGFTPIRVVVAWPVPTDQYSITLETGVLIG
jgi:type II secretory pathway pseudopilin PulG